MSSTHEIVKYPETGKLLKIKSTVTTQEIVIYVFSRNSENVPLYRNGLIVQRVSYSFTTQAHPDYLNHLNNQLFTKPVNEENENINKLLDDMCIDYGKTITKIVYEHFERYNRSVLMDNEDAFFRNMVPPHAYEFVNKELAREDVHVLFTPDMSPPPIRLNFPFIIGETESDLISDLGMQIEKDLGKRLNMAEFYEIFTSKEGKYFNLIEKDSFKLLKS